MTPIEVSLKVCALGDQIMKDIEGMEERERKLYRELLDASVVYVFSRPKDGLRLDE